MTCALITGASAGLGAEFARLFAADGHDLILTARRRDRLEALAAELKQGRNIQVHVIDSDLGAPGGARKLIEAVEAQKLEVHFLVNNAGFGSSGPFAELPPERELEMIQLNCTALIELTRAFLPQMIARKSGRVLNIGSTAGFQPGPFMATYYASKALVNSFSEAIQYELSGSGVTCTVSCPGPTQTEFAQIASIHKSRLFNLTGAADAKTVAREAYRAMHAGRSMIVHGWMNWLVMESQRFAPRAVGRAIAGSLNRPAQKQLK